MRRKKHDGELSPELTAMLRNSPDLQPCREFREADVLQFTEHVNLTRCPECTAMLRQWDKDFRLLKILRDGRN